MASKTMTADGYVTPSDDPNAGGYINIVALVCHGKNINVGDEVLLREGFSGPVVCKAVSSGASGDFGQNYPAPGVRVKTPVYLDMADNGGITVEIAWR